MGIIKTKDIINYIENNIDIFHNKKLEKLKNLKLENILKRKNPYLFRVKNIQTSFEMVKGITDAYISSNEETIFGNWLEGLAIFINAKVYNGRKSGISGIDLEFNKENTRYIVSIKSGPNWGNSKQIEKMRTDFKTVCKTLRTSNSNLQVKCINGCCYGKDNKPDKGDYFKYCGQLFWTFISNDELLYKNIINPLGHKAKIKNEDYVKKYHQKLNLFTDEFSSSFCTNGEIDWEKLLEFNSKK